MADNARNKKLKTIGFRGTEEYREMLQRAALDRKTKVQPMLEEAVKFYLATERNTDSSKAYNEEGMADPMPPDLREWIGILRRATTVRNEIWREMLESIHGQLILAARAADREKAEQGLHTHTKQRSDRGAKGTR